MPTDLGSVRFVSVVDDEHGFTASFMRSFLPLLAVDLGGEQRIWRGGYAFQQCTSAGIVEGRNEAVKSFLESDAEWLFFVDSDMGWEPDGLERLMAAADPIERPILGGLCFGFGPISDHQGEANAIVKRAFPTIFDLVETDDDIAFKARWFYAPGAVQKVGATGAAFLLIHRSVLEAIAAEHGATWFDRIRHPKSKKGLWGEDTSFCVRAQTLGFPVYVHAGVKTSHAKVAFVTDQTYYGELVAQPATEEVAVVVPVLGRPDRAVPFMRSLRASTGLAEVYAVCSEDADEQAWTEAGAHTIRTSRTSFACKANDAADKIGTAFPWLFLCGDDVHFHPGWLDHAQQTAHVNSAKVVGTNDWLNPAVLAGQHGTHVLVATDYIAERGASWDGPGKVCHEGYKHWYVDNEWTEAAKQRGVWASSLASVVEHLHPLAGKAEVDATYELGQKFAKLDAETWQKRARKYGAVAA